MAKVVSRITDEEGRLYIAAAMIYGGPVNANFFHCYFEIPKKRAKQLEGFQANFNKVELAQLKRLANEKPSEKDIREEALERVDQVKQSQASVTDQLIALIPIANKFGLYDAADMLVKFTRTKSSTRRERL